MYAIIVDSGRQHKVEEGQQLLLDYRDLPVGSTLEFNQVLAFRDDAGLRLGQPTLAGALVTGEVIAPEKGPKLVVQKMRRRKTLRRRTGHRQLHTRVQINKIQIG